MPVTIDRHPVWSLWTRPKGVWELLDTSPDRTALERQAKGLQAVFSHTRFLVVQGTQRPGIM